MKPSARPAFLSARALLCAAFLPCLAWADEPGDAGAPKPAPAVTFDTSGIAQLIGASRLEAKDAPGLASRASANFERGDYAKAVAEASQAIAADPKLASAYMTRGRAYEKLRDYDKAVADHNAAVALEPHSGAAYFFRANTLKAKGDLAAALADYNKTIELDPTKFNPFVNRGSTYRELRQYDKALADFNEALRLNPRHAGAYTQRGYLYGRTGQLERAIADYQKAVDYDSQNAYAMNALAWILATTRDAKLRDGPRAVKLTAAACALGDYKAYAHVDTLAAAHAEAGDFAEAVKWQTLAVELSGGEDIARHRLALYRQNQPYHLGD